MIERIIFVLLVIVFIAKDTVPLGSSLILRGFLLGICGLVGLIYLFQRCSISTLKKYLIVFLYILILFVGSFESEHTNFVLLQVASLAAVIVFFIAYWNGRNQHQNYRLIVNASVILYSIVAVVSLVLYVVKPALVSEVIIGGGVRYSGLFPKSGMMALSSGLLVGMIWFARYKWWLAYPLTLVSAVNLGLTLSRTFWIALIVSGLATAWMYSKNKMWIAIVAIIAIFGFLGSLVVDFTFDENAANEVVRAESLSQLNGRLGLWELGFEKAKERLYLGYGFTMGGSAIGGSVGDSGFSSDEISGRHVARITLHNGYLQAILDSGYLGFVFYLLIIIFSILQILKLDRSRKYPICFYSLLFLAVSNFGETVIYAVSVYSGIIFWAFAVMSFSLRKT